MKCLSSLVTWVLCWDAGVAHSREGEAHVKTGKGLSQWRLESRLMPSGGFTSQAIREWLNLYLQSLACVFSSHLNMPRESV